MQAFPSHLLVETPGQIRTVESYRSLDYTVVVACCKEFLQLQEPRDRVDTGVDAGSYNSATNESNRRKIPEMKNADTYSLLS